jgi:hypothetical protein
VTQPSGYWNDFVSQVAIGGYVRFWAPYDLADYYDMATDSCTTSPYWNNGGSSLAQSLIYQIQWIESQGLHPNIEISAGVNPSNDEVLPSYPDPGYGTGGSGSPFYYWTNAGLDYEMRGPGHHDGATSDKNGSAASCTPANDTDDTGGDLGCHVDNDPTTEAIGALEWKDLALVSATNVGTGEVYWFEFWALGGGWDSALLDHAQLPRPQFCAVLTPVCAYTGNPDEDINGGN